jgi:hypothetical protein
MSRLEWTPLMTDQLLDAYQSVKRDRLHAGYLRLIDYNQVAKELNEKLGRDVGTTSIIERSPCKNKIENLKRKYRKEVNNYNATRISSRWIWYDRINELFLGMHRSSGLPGNVEDSVFVKESENHANIDEVDEDVDDECVDEDATGVPLMPPVPAPEPRTVSPRSEMCSQAGVSGQIHRRRQRSVADDISTAMVRTIDRMNATWSKIAREKIKIENKKLALFTRLLDFRS